MSTLTQFLGGGVKSVQSFSIIGSFPSAQNVSGNQAITSVNLTKAFVLVTSVMTTSSASTLNATAKLTTATNVHWDIFTATATAASYQVDIQVIEFF